MHKKCKVTQRGVWRLVKNVKPAAGGENNASRSGGGGRQKWDEKRTDCKAARPFCGLENVDQNAVSRVLMPSMNRSK
jgi:hypothetical protein